MSQNIRRARGLPTYSGIYKIVNDITGETYVGQTVNVRGHASHHNYLLKRDRNYNRPLQSSYNKYGGENFTHHLVELVSRANLTTREQFHLDQVPVVLRFNLQPAGPSGTLGFKQPAAQKLKHSRSKGGRPFYATHEDSNDTFRFEHVGEALKAFPHLQRAHVYACLHGTRYSHAGFLFDYDPAVLAEAPKHRAARPKGPDERSRAIIAKNIATSVETTYAYVAALKDTAFTLSAVYDCLNGKKGSYKGHTWRYADGLPHKPPERVFNKGPRKHGGSRPVVGIDPDTGASVRFAYIRLAAETLGVAHQNISASIKKQKLGKRHTAAGFVWNYEQAQNEIR